MAGHCATDILAVPGEAKMSPASSNSRTSLLHAAGQPRGVDGDETAPRLLVSAKTASRLIDVSESTWHRLDSAGKVPQSIRLTNGTVRWRYIELVEWAEAGCPGRNEWDALKAASNKR